MYITNTFIDAILLCCVICYAKALFSAKCRYYVTTSLRCGPV